MERIISKSRTRGCGLYSASLFIKTGNKLAGICKNDGNMSTRKNSKASSVTKIVFRSWQKISCCYYFNPLPLSVSYYKRPLSCALSVASSLSILDTSSVGVREHAFWPGIDPVQEAIDRMQKWLPINYSFIFVLISLTSLVSMRKRQKNFHTKMRLVSLISIHIKE